MTSFLKGQKETLGLFVGVPLSESGPPSVEPMFLQAEILGEHSLRQQTGRGQMLAVGGLLQK